MGLFYSFLTKYNTLRKPQVFVPNLQLDEGVPLTPAALELDFVLNLICQEEEQILFTKGSKEFKKFALTTLAVTCPNLFFFKNRYKLKGGPLFKGSFRRFKRIIRPLLAYADFRRMPSQTRRVLSLGEPQRFFLVIFMLHHYFLTSTSRFALSLLHHGKITFIMQYYLFYFKLIVYDFGFLTWGFQFYTPRRISDYYEVFAERSQRIQQINKFYAEGVLDFLNEDDFPALQGENANLMVYESDAENTQPLVERPESSYSDKAVLTVHARNELSNKSRYPRNRQTYRTGVL